MSNRQAEELEEQRAQRRAEIDHVYEVDKQAAQLRDWEQQRNHDRRLEDLDDMVHNKLIELSRDAVKSIMLITNNVTRFIVASRAKQPELPYPDAEEQKLY